MEFLNQAIKNHFIPFLAKKNLFICAFIANELFNLLQAYKPESDLRTLALDWLTNDDSMKYFPLLKH